MYRDKKIEPFRIKFEYPDGTVSFESWATEYQAEYFAVRGREHEQRRLDAGVIKEMAIITVEDTNVPILPE